MGVESPDRQSGKSEIIAIAAAKAHKSGKRVFVAAADTTGLTKRLRRYLPTALFEIRGDGVLIHDSKDETDAWKEPFP